MLNVSNIIGGIGIAALARELGHANPTTVQGWKERGVIPPPHWNAVIAATKKLGKPISVDALIAAASGPRRRGRAA